MWYAAYTPPHHCRVAEGAAINATIPWDHVVDNYSSCLIYVNNSWGAGDAAAWGDHEGQGGQGGQGRWGNETRKCREDINEWQYFGDVTDTIVSEAWAQISFFNTFFYW